MTRTPNPKFANWASSYQGMDGGNPKSELWFCGIEYGVGKDPDLTEINFVDDIEGDWIEWRDVEGKHVPHFEPKENGVNNDEMKVSGRFAFAQSKIASSYYRESIDTWKMLSGEKGYCFKMNLYPLPFKSHDDALWTKDHFLRTGLISKSEYKTWNLNNRFPLLKQLVNQFHPKVLICFGQSLKGEYLSAFCDHDEQIFEDMMSIQIVDESNKSKRTLLHTRVNHGNTLLMICPFPTGAHGLNSDCLLKQVAEKAHELRI